MRRSSRSIIAFVQGIVFSILCLVTTAVADVYTFHIQYDSQVASPLVAGGPVSAVQIYGSNGVNSLPGDFTDTSGNWTIDTTQIESPNPVIAFSGANRGLSFSPSEVTLDPSGSRSFTII